MAQCGSVTMNGSDSVQRQRDTHDVLGDDPSTFHTATITAGTDVSMLTWNSPITEETP